MKNQSEEHTIEMPNYVIKLKQDRYGLWQCAELRVQGDTIKEITTRINAASRLVDRKTTILNGK
jgi:hypothetical protein